MQLFPAVYFGIDTTQDPVNMLQLSAVVERSCAFGKGPSKVSAVFSVLGFKVLPGEPVA
jgi:hypothetical protein